MSKKLYADTNVTCIYTGDDSVITNPLGRLEDVFFHSGLGYMNIFRKDRLTLSFPSVGEAPSEIEVVAFAHGLVGYIPPVIAYVNTYNCPFTGSFTLDMSDGEDYTSGDTGGIQKFYLASDPTNVSVIYSTIGSYGPVSLDITFYTIGLPS